MPSELRLDQPRTIDQTLLKQRVCEQDGCEGLANRREDRRTEEGHVVVESYMLDLLHSDRLVTAKSHNATQLR